MYEQSHRDYLRSESYLHHRPALSWAVNHYRDNAITYKAQLKQNARELKLANYDNSNYWHADASAGVAALDAKYTKELADAKAENDALRDDVAAGRRQFAHQRSSLSIGALTTASGVDKLAYPDWQTRWTGLHPQRLICYAKTTGRNPKYINEAVQIELPISMGNSAYKILSNTHALPAEYKC